jgi:hypothetical protein
VVGPHHAIAAAITLWFSPYECSPTKVRENEVVDRRDRVLDAEGQIPIVRMPNNDAPDKLLQERAAARLGVLVGRHPFTALVTLDERRVCRTDNNK